MIDVKQLKQEWLAEWLLKNTEIINPALYGISARGVAEMIVNKFEQIEIEDYEKQHEANLETHEGIEE